MIWGMSDDKNFITSAVKLHFTQTVADFWKLNVWVSQIIYMQKFHGESSKISLIQRDGGLHINIYFEKMEQRKLKDGTSTDRIQ